MSVAGHPKQIRANRLYSRNWSSQLERFGQVLAARAGAIARGLPHVRRGSFAQLSEALEHPLEDGLYDQGSKPAELQFELLQLTVVSLFLTEDLERLRKGVQSLRAAHGSHFDVGGTEDIYDWFDARRHESHAWVNCGQLSFPGDGLRGLVRCVWLHLFRIAPSVACLVLSAFPSPRMAASLSAILTEVLEPEQRLRLGRRANRRWTWYVELMRPSSLRRRALEVLMGEANQALSALLRRHVGAGWSLGGPLPAMEVFGHRNSQEQVNEAPREFWDSVGMHLKNPFNYASQSVHLFAPDPGREAERYARYRFLVDVPSLLGGSDSQGYADEQTAIALKLHERIGRFAIAVGLEEHIRRMRDTTGNMRAELAPQLGRSRSLVRSGLFRWSRAFYYVQELNRLDFDANRIEAEIDWSKIDLMTGHRLGHLVRGGIGSEPKEVRLTDDLAQGLAYRWSYVTRQIRVLREAFRSRLDYGLQQVITWLTIVGVLLAIPERFREEFIDRAVALFRSLAALIGG